MKRYEIISYDVWGNAKDGYEVNDAHRTGIIIELPEECTDRHIRRALYDCGYCTRSVLWSKLEVCNAYTESGSIYMEHNSIKEAGRPFCELRPVD